MPCKSAIENRHSCESGTITATRATIVRLRELLRRNKNNGGRVCLGRVCLSQPSRCRRTTRPECVYALAPSCGLHMYVTNVRTYVQVQYIVTAWHPRRLETIRMCVLRVCCRLISKDGGTRGRVQSLLLRYIKLCTHVHISKFDTNARAIVHMQRNGY